MLDGTDLTKDRMLAGYMRRCTTTAGGTVFATVTTDGCHSLAGTSDSAVDQITRNLLDRLGKVSQEKKERQRLLVRNTPSTLNQVRSCDVRELSFCLLFSELGGCL